VILVASATVLLGGQATARSESSSRSTPGIVFERNGDLFAISLDGSRTVRLTNTPVWREYSPAVSPDGRWIAYARRWLGSSTIWIRSIDGRVQERITRGSDANPTWSPDGRTIYFSRYLTQADKGPNFSFNEDCGAIFRIGANGRDVRRLTNPPWEDSFHSHWAPSVSPDGSRIAFTDANQCSGGTTSVALRVIDASGRTTSDLSRLPGNVYYPDGEEYGAPAWSPDGRRLAFVSGWNASVLFTANRDGSDLRRLTPKRLGGGDSFQDGPAWSADGAWIAFASYEKHADLYVIHPDGTGLRRLTRTKADESSPAWLPRMPAG